ncbi:MAG TPA: hypothetical protein VHY10_17880 [Xanthobacteraceae bacterium]|jgi:hypothetical protein|nr:hypothetical protein [Xanthobacteraceae bacterium]
MPKSSPITREHILDAMTYVGSDSPPWPFCSRTSTYVVIDPRTGAGLPPKLVLTTAAEMASPDRRRAVLSGGQHTNRKLTELGFVVVEKASLHQAASGHADPVGA